MKKAVKFAVLAASVVAFGSTAFAADVEFYNKLKSKFVEFEFDKDDSENNKTSFPGFHEDVYVKVETDQVDVEGEFEADINIAKVDGLTVKEENIEYDLDIEFRPVSWLTIGFSNEIMSAGSYITAADDDLAAADIGNDFLIAFRPAFLNNEYLDGLTITAGLNMPANMFMDKDESKLEFTGANVGVRYLYDAIGGLTFSARNIGTDDASYGFYWQSAKFGDSGVSATLGYTIGGKADIIGLGADVLNAGVQYDADIDGKANSFGVDFAYSYEENPEYNMYIGAAWYGCCFDKADLGAWGYVNLNTDPDVEAPAKWMVNLYSNIFVGDHNKFQVGVNLSESDNTLTLNFPCYWQWSL